MSKLNVIRASAGSGKTYRITADYLNLLFRYPKNYKHILAVTFTNKATEEMKGRILNELYRLSHNIYSSYSASISKKFNLSQSEIQEKSKNILENILHNYSRFTVSTIDSFFQRIVKSFAREAGLQYNFEIELDINNVLEKATDQMLLKLGTDKTLLEWLVQYANQRIVEGKNWDFKKEIIGLGKELFNEKFNSLDRTYLKKLTDRENLKTFQKLLYSICSSFETKLKKAGDEGMNLISKHGLKPNDFKFGLQGGVGQYFYKLSTGEVAEPSKRINEATDSVENWLPKGTEEAEKIRSVANAGLFTLLKNIVDHFKENYVTYNSSTEILAGFYTLGILADLSVEVNDYATRKNIFLLANSGVFLKAIINENDSPFIYEKTGQNIYNYMVDEFQDTSAVQWHNFLPLIKNSLSENHECMIVGDVKQSIYRWRNSDWKIMATRLDTDISDHGIEVDNLLVNWRSKSNIVAFNNTFFTRSSNILQQSYNQDFSSFEKSEKENELLKHLISNAYENSLQKLPSDRKMNEGCIKMQFIENKNHNWKETALTLLPALIDKILVSGQRLGDIAILVRTTAEGSEVTEFLNSFQEKNHDEFSNKYQVISNESTFLRNSPVVSFLTKLFLYLSNPEDAVNAASLAYDYEYYFKEPGEVQKQYPYFNNLDLISNGQQTLIGRYISLLPKEFSNKTEQLKNLTPDELFESLILLFGLNKRVLDLPFLQAFHDCIYEFMQNNVSNLIAFLDYWEEKKSSLSVSVSEDQDAVKVMTVHKSKGLEFKNVIIPFCNWSFDHNWPNSPFIWCSAYQEPFRQMEFMPLRYSSGLKNTVFANNYYLEKAQSYVDNLNLLYVAFTRASDNLFVFAPLPEKEEKLTTTGELIYNWIKTNEILKNTEYPVVSISENWKECDSIFEIGEIGQSEIHIDSITGKMPLLKYPNNELQEKLRQRYSLPGYWDAAENNRPPVRTYGNLMHRLFQEIYAFKDIDAAVDKLIILGLIKESDRKKMIAEVQSILSEKPFSDWFNGSWSIMNEAGIFVPGEHLYRPDRVMTKGKATLIIDYKFGGKQNTKYNYQVKRYVEYLKAMGHSKAEGIIWYVNLNLVERV